MIIKSKSIIKLKRKLKFKGNLYTCHIKISLNYNFDIAVTNEFVNLELNQTFMKKSLSLLFLLSSAAVYAQPKVFTQAIITTKTTVVAPEAGDERPAGNFTSESGEQIRVVRFGGDGETKTTTWLKNQLVKTYSESEMARTTAIRDNEKKLTTTIVEAMGRKSGFYATDEEQDAMRKQIDSMMRNRAQANNSMFSNSQPTYQIVYIDETKKLAGYNCKKAIAIGTFSSGRLDSTLIWYCPDFKLQGVSSTGGSGGGFGNFSAAGSVSGMEDLNGFPIQYEKTMRNGGKMTVQVTKLVTDKDVADKEFEISKDIDLKPMKEMQNGGGPGFRMQITQ